VKVVQTLEALGIRYAIVGSIASSLWGEPRATHDVDLVVMLSTDDLPALQSAFPWPEYYLDEVAASEAIVRRDEFNVLAVDEGVKVDIWPAKDEFDEIQLQRARREEVEGHAAWFSSPEDVILAKLAWAKASGGSERQFRDALRVYEVQRPNLDLGYMGVWVSRLGIDELWQRLLASATVV